MLPRPSLASPCLAGLASLLLAASASAQVISINFNGQGTGSPGARPGPYDLAPTDVAGVLPVPNWNNVPSAATTTPITLNSSAGAATVRDSSRVSERGPVPERAFMAVGRGRGGKRSTSHAPWPALHSWRRASMGLRRAAFRAGR